MEIILAHHDRDRRGNGATRSPPPSQPSRHNALAGAVKPRKAQPKARDVNDLHRTDPDPLRRKRNQDAGTTSERDDDDDLATLSKEARKTLDRALASLVLAKSDPLRILQAVRTGAAALTEYDLEPGYDAALAHLQDVGCDHYGLPPDDIQAQISGGTKDAIDRRWHSKPNGQAGGPEAGPAKPVPPKSPDDYGIEPPPRWPDLGDGGKPSRTCTNARKAIEVLGIECRYDIFHDRMLVGGHAIGQLAGELSDHACQMLRVLIKEKFGFDPGRENTHDAAVQLCLRQQFDPIRDYFDGLRWDRTRRLDKWMGTYLGAGDTELTRAIGRLSLVAAVRRVRDPGSKFDQIPVLEGPEGTGKSTAIEILAGKENFSDQTILGLNDREQQEVVRGVLLHEIADLAGMSKADVDKTKAFASRLSDRARPAYARAVVALPRRCIFIATTNNETYLKSQTGNRRFWPVKTGEINLVALKRDRDQLWAEAAQIEAAGAALKLPETLWATAAAEQDRRRDPDPWDELLANVKGEIYPAADGRGEEERIATITLLSIHLKLPADKANDAAAKRLGFCMARLGWEKAADPIRTIAGKVRGFRRPVTGGQ